jgi:hypothetical protein
MNKHPCGPAAAEFEARYEPAEGPETPEEFLARMRRNNINALMPMVNAGIFYSIDDDCAPIPHPRKFSISELVPGATMANIVVLLGLFPSLSQARKNQWDKPLTLGVHSLTKKKVLVEIVP